ncbi:beta strand repeat-containing protein [Baaleninema simplex]|uniref:beta strand repeat-containing protein n=1 Tax=Baaleninema simplex TaxID=2862350 RepID=UPI00034900CF|nr:S-layer family protein [Baaleninema simplex]
MKVNIAIGVLFSILWLGQRAAPVSAQIVPDATLPERSTVTVNSNRVDIHGGTRRGDNLYHSFDRFSVLENTEAIFNNAIDVRNIITRVTGNEASAIDGVLSANGTANLYLLNPNGIVFGENARLDVGGSFFASTGDSWTFGDGREFSATDPTSSPLLSVNVPVGVQLGRNPGAIANRSRATDANGAIAGLQVPTGEILSLMGGDIRLDGGVLTASYGRVNLIALRDTLQAISPAMEAIAIPSNSGIIELTNTASLETSGEGGGAVRLVGGDVRLSNATIVANTLGSLDGGGIAIDTHTLTLDNGALIVSATLGTGASNAIDIRASESVSLVGRGFQPFQAVFVGEALEGRLTLEDWQNGIFTGTTGAGNAGNIHISTSNFQAVAGQIVATQVFDSGSGGDISIEASESVELIGSALSSATLSSGNAGNLTIDTGELIVRDGAFISASTIGTGAGADVTVRATESVEVFDVPPDAILATSIVSVSFANTGLAGDVTIDTQRLSLRNGGVIDTSSGNPVFPVGGAAGNLTVRASESVEVVGRGRTVFGGALSLLGSRTFSLAPAGRLTVETERLSLRDGGQVAALTAGAGDGGQLTVRATESVDVVGFAIGDGGATFPSRISSGSTPLPEFAALGLAGRAGQLTIATERLNLRDSGQVTVTSLGAGDAGQLAIAADRVWLDDGASLSASTLSGLGGNIEIRSDDLRLRRTSQVATNAGNANGGNIVIETETLTALENSDITANAETGRGGRVEISARAIFGTQFRARLTPKSDITATSELGPEFSGVVEIQNPDIETNSGLVELTSDPVDVSGLVSDRCAALRAGSRFVVLGRGGLPPNPLRPLQPTRLWRHPDSLPLQTETADQQSNAAGDRPIAPSREPLIEATGWQRGDNGEVVLVAETAARNLERLPQVRWGGCSTRTRAQQEP